MIEHVNLLGVVADYSKDAMKRGVPMEGIEPLMVTEAEFDRLMDQVGTHILGWKKPVPWRTGYYLGKVFGVKIIAR